MQFLIPIDDQATGRRRAGADSGDRGSVGGFYRGSRAAATIRGTFRRPTRGADWVFRRAVRIAAGDIGPGHRLTSWSGKGLGVYLGLCLGRVARARPRPPPVARPRRG